MEHCAPERSSGAFPIACLLSVALVCLVCLPFQSGCEREEGQTLSWMESECLDCSTKEELDLCHDGEDNDEDGLTDCDDPDCEGVGCCGALGSEDSDEACADGCDNDGDGYVDCGDFSCSKGAEIQVCKGTDKVDENTPATCSDGLDNDWDGYFDCDDFDCAEAQDVTFCEGNDQTCSDNVDNDGDGYVDCEDFSCSKNSSVTVCE